MMVLAIAILKLFVLSVRSVKFTASVNMKTIYTVSNWDIQTKRTLLKQKGAEVSLFPNEEDKAIVDAWPDEFKSIIIYRCGHYPDNVPWLVPIDLGDSIKLSASSFRQLLVIKYPNAEDRTRENIKTYLNQLISTDADLYKMMAKLDIISRK